MQTLKLGAHLQPELGVEVGKRLIHEKHFRIRRKRSGDGNALLLSAGKLAGIAIHEHADFDNARYAAHNQINFLVDHLANAAHGLSALHQRVIRAERAAVLLGFRLLRGDFAL